MKGNYAILLIASVLIAGLLSLSGCTLEGEENGDLLPSRGYGTLKLSVDDVGPEAEVDEAGNKTGRYGFYYDTDQDREWDQFYQIDKPSGGIVALSFDPVTGFADAAYPVAMTRFTPGKTFYEIPLESLTEWVKNDQALGYRKAQYVDQPNILVYMDRVKDIELEAPLTGNRQVFGMNMVSLGAISPSGSSTANAMSMEEPEYVEEGDLEGDGDIAPARLGDVNSGCNGWGDICEYEKGCGFFANNWTIADCKQNLYNVELDARQKRYVSCLKQCTKKACGGFDECKSTCFDENVTDAYGCSGQYAPEITDVIYVVKRGGSLYRVEKGINLEDGDELAIFVQYADVEADFGGGQLVVSFGSKTKTFDVPKGIGYSSFEDKAYIGFAVEGPLPAGDYDFTVKLIDNGCELEGPAVNGSFSSNGQTDSGLALDTNFKMDFEMFEIYSSGLDKFNLGKGFVDVRSLMIQPNANYLYELMEFDVAIIQAYFWTFTNTDKFQGLSWRDINGLIFTTTHDTRKTKYDESDDVQAMSFYIDQPMSSGLFTFYGDAGWNIYPKSPYGDNEDQPFIRGDFKNTTIHIPFTPAAIVDDRYVGCNDTCDYWIDFIYGKEARSSVRGFDSQEDALAHCKEHSADPFWRGLFGCYKKSQAGINGCISLDSCLDSVPDPGNGPQLCDALEDVYLNIHVNIDQAYLANETYYQALLNAEGKLKLGVYYQDGATAVWSMLPGGFVDFDINQRDYRVHLPYMPLVPNGVMQIVDAEGVAQSQMYIALVEVNDNYDIVYGTGYFPPNDELDGDWFWLLIYSYNWTDPEGEGWTIGPVSENTIYGYKNIYEEVIDINFGDARAVGGSILPY